VDAYLASKQAEAGFDGFNMPRAGAPTVYREHELGDNLSGSPTRSGVPPVLGTGYARPESANSPQRKVLEIGAPYMLTLHPNPTS